MTTIEILLLIGAIVVAGVIVLAVLFIVQISKNGWEE